MGEGVLYNFIFTELPFKTVSGDVTAFHRIGAYMLAMTKFHICSISIRTRQHDKINISENIAHTFMQHMHMYFTLFCIENCNVDGF